MIHMSGWRAVLVVLLTVAAGQARAEEAAAPAGPMNADAAVKIALKHGSDAIRSKASIQDALGNYWGAANGVLPAVSLNAGRSGSLTQNQPITLATIVGTQVVTGTGLLDVESYQRNAVVSGSWAILNPSAIAGYSSAKNELKSAKLQDLSTRQDIGLSVRRQYYEVVKAIKLAQVSDGALRLSRDNERRVRALFEVGSVSRSDLLKAQVQTAQSELDSITNHQQIVAQRITLANLIGIPENSMGEVDTTLAYRPMDYDEATLIKEALANRPDLKAADASLKSAHAGLGAARYSRLPYLVLSGSVNVKPAFDQKSDADTMPGAPHDISRQHVESDRIWSGTIALRWDFNVGTDSRIASARANLMRAEDTRTALNRDLEGDIRSALFTYRQAVAGSDVAQRSIESATETYKLIQQKYNVGSSTILDLIDAQVQLERAYSDLVNALAVIRVAEAQLNRLAGRGE
ncbi:MAG TPA: TolC family protein [Candidatus Sulfotelmatobacter sp.]|nr:TolC family protein [Candidatus Sulfotelmatobacter sp.]